MCTVFCTWQYANVMISTSVQSNLAKGRIADLSLLADANEFVRSQPPSKTWFHGPRRVSRFLHSTFVCSCDEHTETYRQTETHRPRCVDICSICRLVAWYSGRTSVSNRRTFPVLRSTCNWWVTTYVGKPSATRPANQANSAFPLFEVDKWVVSCNRMCATSLGWRHLVNAYGVKARWFIPFVDKRVGGR